MVVRLATRVPGLPSSSIMRGVAWCAAALAATAAFPVAAASDAAAQASAEAAAPSEWTWYSGNSTGCVADHDESCAGSYGKRGVASAANLPGARCCAHTWQQNGTLFLFGGWGFDAAGDQGYLNDLWSFDVDTAAWAWLGGSQQINQANTANWPATRHYAAYGFDAEHDALYLFSGLGGTDAAGDWLTDLWRLDITPTSRGADIAGASSSSAASPRAEGIAARRSASGPVFDVTATLLTGDAAAPGRYWTNFWFAAGKLWVLGGIGKGKESFNDMWVYDPRAGVGGAGVGVGAGDGWTRLYDRTGPDAVGVYSGPAQFPGRRENAFTAVSEAGDGSTLWMFGGSGYGQHNASTGDLNDVWRFDTAARNWTFAGGTPGAIEDAGKCGAPGVFAADNLPEGRHAGFNVARVTPSGRMYVVMGEHHGEKDVYGDVWALQVQQPTRSHRSAVVAGNSSVEAAVFTEHCNICNTNASYSGSNLLPGSRFAGNAWVLPGKEGQAPGGGKAAAKADRVFVYGGWGIDASQQLHYLSDMWVALAPN